MEDQNKKINKKTQKLIEDLQSKDPSKISAAIKALEIAGSIEVLRPMIEILEKPVSEQIKAEILEFLSSLKHNESKDEIIRILRTCENPLLRNDLLSTIWNSPLNYTEFLSDFVALAIEGDYLEALECLTIIENMEGSISESQIMESQLLLQEFFKQNQSIEEKKRSLIQEIAILIDTFSKMDEDDYIEMYN